MNNIQNNKQAGAITASVVAAVLLGIFSLVFAGLAVWAYMSYDNQKMNVDSKVGAAVVDAKKTQADSDEAKYRDLLQQPYIEFVGPDDFGRLTFNYPKTWSSFVAKDGSSGSDFEAYLNPVSVPPLGTKQQFALRVTMNDTSYTKTLDSYQSLIKKGSLTSSTFSANGQDGTRLDGSFSKDIRGSAVIFKVRDKTLTLRTDADTFKPKFEELIKTVKFNT